jgi:hypothetical protein
MSLRVQHATGAHMRQHAPVRIDDRLDWRQVDAGRGSPRLSGRSHAAWFANMLVDELPGNDLPIDLGPIVVRRGVLD